MNKKLIPAISIGIAVLLIGSIAYASDRRRNAKAADRIDNNIHEEEILRAELLEDIEPREIKAADTANKTMAAVSLDDLIENVAPDTASK